MKISFALLLFLAFVQIGKAYTSTVPFKVNSGYDEQNPVIAPDGKTLFLTIANHPQNLGGKRDPGDIWFCKLGADSTWSQPVHGGVLINDRAYNGVAGFSADGLQMYLLTHYGSNGTPARTQGISVSHKNAEGWSKPENVNIPYFQNKSSIVTGFVSFDEKYFIFSAETYGSFGVEDIFVCERGADGKWSEPQNLGSKINTQFQEVAPSLSLDGRTLYYSSNGKKGNGSFDIFSSNRLDDSWKNWSEPVNISDVNSEGKDLFYREFSFLGFSIYTSTKDSDGYGEIKFYTPEVPYKKDSLVVTKDTTRLALPAAVVIAEKKYSSNEAHDINVFGKVFNSKTGEVIPARLTITSNKNNQSVVVNAAAEGFASTVQSLNQYKIRVEARGFISSLENLDVQSFEMDKLEMNFKLQPAEVGTTVNLKSVLFAQSKTDLLPESYPELDLVVQFLKENSNVKIELSGHTDNRGVPFQNVKLSQGRVDKVREYLISKGVDGRRISGTGYGGTKPIASNESEDTRKLNRRVEFTIK